MYRRWRFWKEIERETRPDRRKSVLKWAGCTGGGGEESFIKPWGETTQVRQGQREPRVTSSLFLLISFISRINPCLLRLTCRRRNRSITSGAGLPRPNRPSVLLFRRPSCPNAKFHFFPFLSLLRFLFFFFFYVECNKRGSSLLARITNWSSIVFQSPWTMWPRFVSCLGQISGELNIHGTWCFASIIPRSFFLSSYIFNILFVLLATRCARYLDSRYKFKFVFMTPSMKVPRH